MDLIHILSVWLHITSASILVGGVFYLRFIVIKYGQRTGGLSDELRKTYIGRYLHLSAMLMSVLLVTGFYNFFTKMAEWKTAPEDALMAPHAIFGIKFLAFLLYIGLVVITGTSKGVNESRRPKLLLVQAVLGLVILFLSAWLSNSY
ncbi:MAG: hypothetical protein ACFCU1_08665 [Sumerlaeia bacterium]